ncbi:MAG: hypothetical protein WC803_08760 [Sphingomonas sp.]
MSVAWHIEAFGRMKKLPSLEKVLGRTEARAPVAQSNEEMLAAMRAWAAISKDAAKEKGAT